MKVPLIRILLALCFASVTFGQTVYSPIPLNTSSFNQDVVVEAAQFLLALNTATTASVDGGTNNNANTWYEVGYNTSSPTSGLPQAGTTFTAVSNSNYSFKMANSYSAPNAILIDTVITNGTFTLVTPASYGALSFLSSGGNGGDVIGVTVRHSDGTSEVGQFASPDWFNGTSNVAWIAYGRVNSTVNFTFDTQASLTSPGNPRLYYRDMTLTNITPVVAVDFKYNSGAANSHNPIFAMSGASTPGGIFSPIIVTGYAYDFVIEEKAPKRGPITASTTMSMDTLLNTGNTWYEKGFNKNNPNLSGALTGLPAAGTTLTNVNASNQTYVLPPNWAANNALYLSPSVTNGTLTFATPANYTALSFLAAAGNGPSSNTIVINHQDGRSETNVLGVPDWFNNNVPFAFIANGRVAVDTGQFNNVNSTDPRLFPLDVSLTITNSPVTSVNLTYVSTGGREAIFAVSGASGAVQPIYQTQPVSVKTFGGDTVTFSASVTGSAPVTYQWQRGTNGVFVNVSNGGNVSGANSSSLVISGSTKANNSEYRLIASNAGGSVFSTTNTLTVMTQGNNVLNIGDTLTDFPNVVADPVGQGQTNIIDRTLAKWLNFGKNTTPWGGPVGFVVTPAMGRTIVTTVRFYAANDTTARDPADFTLEGSNDGGSSYSLITSNTLISSTNLSYPTTRNAATGAINPLTQVTYEVDFPNTFGYSTYRLTVNNVRSAAGANSLQIGEVEFLGVIDTSKLPTLTPVIGTRAYNKGSVVFSTTPGGSPAPTVKWQKSTGTNNVFSDLVDGPNVSGATTPTLTLNNVTFADAGAVRAVASNSAGSINSSIAPLVVISELPDVTDPNDPITDFGDVTGGARSTAPSTAIDNGFFKYVNGGSGFNAPAGFAPFSGPVGLVVTPAMGSTVVSGFRIYPAEANAERDPIDFTIEGSNNGGTNYTLITSNSLAVPQARTSVADAMDPLVSPMQELLFNNTKGFTTYRVTFYHSRNDSASVSMQFAEMELLGVAGVGRNDIKLTVTSSGGKITISSDGNGTLQTATSLSNSTVWTDVGPITGSTTITPTKTETARFYRVKSP